MADDIEIITDESGETHRIYEFKSSRSKLSSWKAKAIFWGTVVAGIAVGTVLFLFFITLFIYFILPILAILTLWGAFRYWQIRRKD